MTSETQFEPDWFSKPGDSILALMRRKGMSANEVAANLEGGMDTLRGLLAGRVPVGETVARELAQTVGGSSSFWIRRQSQFEETLGRVVDAVMALDHDRWLNDVPIPGPSAGGRMSDARRRGAIRDRLVFFDVNGPEAWGRRYGYLRSETQFRTSPTLASHHGATSMWLRQGELEAALVATSPLDRAGLLSSIGDVLRLSLLRRPADFLPRLRRVLARFGVALVGVRAPDGCRASGATRMLSANKAMLAVSFRHRSDDHFWFTVLHEIGHILLHGGRAFVDDEDTTEDAFEREANAFAAAAIVPPARVPEFELLGDNPDAVIRLGVSLGIAPGLVVGQLQHRGRLGHGKLAYLRRRWSWDEVDEALAQPL